jgi:lysozyme family protein
MEKTAYLKKVNKSGKAMANHEKIVPFFYKWEGGLSKDQADAAAQFPCPTPYKGSTGWHTAKGVTYGAWVAIFGTDKDDRFFKMDHNDWGLIFKRGYWDKVKGDHIELQSIAEVLVSWAWGSGSRTAIKEIQRELKLKVDGIIGPKTLGAINSSNEAELFDRCIKRREAFFRGICITRPRNKRFLRGWLNRLRDFEKKFKP